MDILNTFVGAIPLDTDVPTQARMVVEGLGFLSQMVMGTGAAATGLTCTPGSGLSVSVGAGALVQLQTLAPVASGSMAADTTPCVQQGINTAATTLALSGSGTWTVYGMVSVALGGAQVLPYYNAANPAQPYAGPANNGQASYTQTQARVTLGATTGSIPAGAVALYTVTVPSGATTVTQAEIAQVSGGPFWATIPQLAPILTPVFQQGISVATQSPVNGTFLQAGPVHSGDFGAILVNVPAGYTALLMQLGINGTPLFHVAIDGSVGSNASGAFGGNLGVVGTATVGGACSLGATSVNGNLSATGVYTNTLSVNGAAGVGGELIVQQGIYAVNNYICTNHDFNDGTDPVANQIQGGKYGGGGLSLYPAAGKACANFGSTGAGPIITLSNNAATAIGSISNSGNNSVAFNQTSDRRLKDDIEPIGFDEARDRLLAMRPSHFRFIHGDQTRLQGFIADEVAQIYPYAVHGAPDALLEDGRISPQGVDLNKGLPADMVAAVQGLLRKVESLEATIASMQGVA